MVTIQSQNFGVEIEMTGVSRGTAASVIANYFGVGGIHFAGGTYQTYEAKDSKGRVWKCMRDGSITPRLLNFATGRQDLFYEALQIGSRADHWCHKINPALFREMKKNGRASRNDAERIWYSVVNDGYDGGVDSSHYNSPYDCTGQEFTNRYKLFRRRGHWFAYHSVSRDV